MNLKIIMVVLYLSAAVAANLAVSVFGPGALPLTAFVMIPFDMAARDVLHEAWAVNRARNMTLLVISGSLLTVVVSYQAKTIALASFCAFASSNLIDYVVYSKLIKKHRLIKMNASNFCASITDSLVFPAVAFGAISPSIAVSQTSSKFIGGFIWSLILNKMLNKLKRGKNGKQSS